jgi:hypothetical protein
MRNEGVTKTAGQGQARQKRNIWVVKKTKKKPKKKKTLGLLNLSFSGRRVFVINC